VRLGNKYLRTSWISRPSLVGRKPVRKQQKKLATWLQTDITVNIWKHSIDYGSGLVIDLERLRMCRCRFLSIFFIAQTDRTITKMQINLFLRFWKPLLSQSLMLFALFLSFIFDRWEKCYILQICNIWLRTCKRYSNIQYLF
jgi:hypothetical protein